MVFVDLVPAIMTMYQNLSFQPPSSQYTILASFSLVSTPRSKLHILSLATGTKCLPESKLPSGGEAVHDSHAEVLARRGALRWFLEEIGRCRDTRFQSEWISLCTDGKYALKDDVELILYISTVPCKIPHRPSMIISQAAPNKAETLPCAS